MTAAAVELTLLLPGLAGPDDPGGGDPVEAVRLLTSGLELPGLGVLLGRAASAPAPLPAATLDGLLFEAFAVARGQECDWPAGAVSRQGFSGDAGAAAWLRADPVHLRADMGRLILFPAATLDLTLDEAARLAQWLNGHEHAPGPAVEPATAGCWVARLDAAPRMTTTAPSLAHGQDADACLPRGPDARAWHARMNEIQMLLHQCPVNAQREARGVPAVNSLWFWGGGCLPGKPRCGLAGAWGDHDLLAGLARVAEIPGRPLPVSAGHLLQQAGPGMHLVALDALEQPAGATDMGGWCAALETLERDWFAPLVRCLSRGRVSRVHLHAGRGAAAGITRRDARRWWRRTPALARSLAALRRERGS